MDWFNSGKSPGKGNGQLPSKTTPMRVSELSEIIETLLDDDRLQKIWVRGEITNYSRHSRGHRYFSLSEKGTGISSAVIRCVMWRSSAEHLAFAPEDGMEVIVSGSVRHYAPHGVYQLQIEEMLRAGIGEKYLLVETWKRELAEEGLFAPEQKRPLPPFPARVGVVTSETGAVIHDIMTVISRRFPLEIVVSPTSVQGEGVHEEIARAIRRLSGIADVVIVARGGGSFEDLFPFNHPDIVRAIRSCPVPVVSAIGHEVDVTLADLAADLRAPTPSAAAELVVPDKNALCQRLGDLQSRLTAGLNGRISSARDHLDGLRDRLRPRRFARTISERKQGTADLADRLLRAYSLRLSQERQNLSRLLTSLDAGNPLGILSRGYCIVEKEGRIVREARDLGKNDHIGIRFADGRCLAIVERVDNDRNL